MIQLLLSYILIIHEILKNVKYWPVKKFRAWSAGAVDFKMAMTETWLAAVSQLSDDIGNIAALRNM